MPFFILDYERNEVGYRTIHKEQSEDCPNLPAVENQLALGFFENSFLAAEEAKKMEDNVERCELCCIDQPNDIPFKNGNN